MCHEPDSRPPAPPVIGDLASTGQLELTADDGTVLAGYEAIPVGEPRARIVILPDVRGLHPYYRALAERFAEAGLYAVTIDYFGRVAGAEPRDDSFPWQEYLPKVTAQDVRLDVGAAVRHLSPEGTHPVFTVGFCFGGGHSWRLAASDLGLAGAIGFYGRPGMAEEVVDDVTSPILMLVAGADHATPVAANEALAQQLTEAGKDVELAIFEGAPHSFFDRSFAEHAEACDEAWRRILAFVDRLS